MLTRQERSKRFIKSSAVALAALACQHAAFAGEVYVQAGLPGLGIGYAHPVNSSLTLRADAVSLGSKNDTVNEEGVDYRARIKTSRVGLFADWHPMASGFRVTGGLTSTNYGLALNASGAGQVINVGGTNYTLTAADSLDVKVKYPSTMPYVGIGWGHHVGSGIRFAFDLGVGVGKPKVSAVGVGQLASTAAQADVDRELAELRDGIGKVSVLPQLSIAVGYSF